jgi:lantibiotic biosynthesis dehydratase-like protein
MYPAEKPAAASPAEVKGRGWPRYAEGLPDHLLALPGAAGEEFALWRTAGLRGAGFPLAQVLELAEPACAAAADRLRALESEAERLREAALASVRGELEGAGQERLGVLIKAIRRLKKGKPPRPSLAGGLGPASAAAVEAWQAAAARAAEAGTEYGQAFAAAQESLSRKLSAVGRRARLREALLWQNRYAAETGLATLRRREGDGPRTSRERQRELMLVSYLQRYCAKNDTIGFFGPVGWARLGEGEAAMEARPGADLLAGRRVFFEGWAIDAVVDLLARDEAMRPWLAPRRTPLLRRRGAVYSLPGGSRVLLGPAATALLAACDGSRPARDVVREVLRDPATRGRGEADLYELLEDLRARGLISWTFQVPLTLTPERELRELLVRVEDAAQRERGLAILDLLEEKRAAVVRAAGRPDELDRALAALEESFTRTTGLAPTHSHGRIYSGRTLLWEECRRDLDLRLGRPLVEELAAPLALVLQSARWYTHQTALGHRAVLDRIYGEMSRQARTPSLELLPFLGRALPELVGRDAFTALQNELHERWARVLCLPAGGRRVALRSEELWPRAMREFAAPGPGWQKARYHSPDLLIAAESVEAVRRGDYLLVMGEIHLAVNTLDLNVFLAHWPDADRLHADIEADLPEPSIIPLLPKKWRQTQEDAGLGFVPTGITGRLDVALRSRKDVYVDLGLDPPAVPPEQILPIADLVVEPGEGGLVARRHDDRIRFDLIDFFQMILKILVVKTFKVMPSRPYTPRITVDRLVLTRESWSFPVDALGFARAHGMPRFLFFKAPNEPKPVYLDLESPYSVEIFARAARQAVGKHGEEPAIAVSEMLPTPADTWLPDAEGKRYTSELRIVAVDLR